jgi:hypothetical protein
VLTMGGLRGESQGFQAGRQAGVRACVRFPWGIP